MSGQLGRVGQVGEVGQVSRVGYGTRHGYGAPHQPYRPDPSFLQAHPPHPASK